MLDGGASETAAVTDINRDGRLDIVSGDNWYEGPAWTRHHFRELNFTNNYVDDFSDLPVDVNGDGNPDIVSVSWFAKKIAWCKNPGKARGAVGRSGHRHRLPDGVRAARGSRQRRQGPGSAPAGRIDQTPLAWYEAKAGSWIKHVVTRRVRPRDRRG